MADIYSEIVNFFQIYFFSGYTVFNTVVYGLLLIIALFFVIKLFKYLDKDPSKLIFSVIPFIFVGSTTRALVDNGIFPYNWLLITPGIYFIIGGLTIISLFVSIWIERTKNIDYRYIIFLIGIIVAIPVLVNIQGINIIPLSYVVATFITVTIIIAIISLKWDLLKDKYNFSIISAHILDASSTFIAVDFFGYNEQHVLPNLIYSNVNTAISMFPLKIIVILLALYAIDKYIEDTIIKGLLKLTVFVLGLAPGLRNLITLSMGLI
ncbi:DUF63 family protein [Methanobrevibacter filiformis]|uniref:DUF63 family protein n=1 Tax=Methanobrevibacter filiformis TaxID=55758 RepID=A0A162FGB9_9EURY|nr:DUF63 family protein [Methanobrevibacter filiformis]KZX12635.1 hypothetical protein MBFIL_11010 [Methanobrevibacter filiformis]